MKVTGTSTLSADRATVWRALNDPAVLVRTIPGCQRLEALGDDSYSMTVAAGVGTIKGVYDGQVRLSDHEEPSSFRMHAQGAGAPGTIGADVQVSLADTPDGGTELTYEADAVVGGVIGGVGQRMLTGVSKRMAAEFFRNVDTALAGEGALVGAVTPATGGAGFPEEAPGPTPSGASRLPPGPSTAAADASVQPHPSDQAAGPESTYRGGAAGTVFTAPQKVAAGGPSFGSFGAGVAVGAAAALAGALVGAWIAGRRR